MAEKNIKALVIKVNSKAEPSGVEHKWDSLTSRMPTFTKSIITPAIGVDKEGKSEVNIGAIVSGMPTVFARANLFVNALNSITDKNAEAEGLLGFYKSLVDEWRGFIACIALDYSKIEVRRINLAYSDGKKIIDTHNIYEPKGAFGNVLFERKALWCDQTLANNAEKIPFIDVITYNKQVVGGTSPESFLFTSVAYNIKDKEPFINIKNGSFTDPLHSNLPPEQLNVLYGYVKHITNNVENFRVQFNGLNDLLKPRYDNLIGNLQDWLKEMEAFAKKNGFTIKEQIPELTNFQKPFSTLFNNSTELFGSEGTITTDDNLEGAIAFDPNNLLLPDGTEIAQLDFGKEGTENRNFLQNRPIYILRAETIGKKDFYSYFALPLSPLALNVFGKNLGSLVGIETSNVQSRITGEYDPNQDKLIVNLKLFTQNGNEIGKSKVYNVGKELKGHDILMWPNFISKQWGRYFLYSEVPHNDAGYQTTPFVGDVDDDFFRIIIDDNGVPVYLSKNGRISIPDKFKEKIKAQLHVVSNNAVADNKYKYEIYESDQPFKGVKFSYAGKDCGFAIIRYSTLNDSLPKNRLKDTRNLAPAYLGVDFGSTNSSVAYFSQKDQKVMDEIVLKNKRVSLLSSDAKNNNERPAVEDEIFFFQNDEIKTNAIKSVLTIHDSKRLVKDNESQEDESLFAQAVKGGFPCFEKNLPIETATENRYTLAYNRVGAAELVHNMKWSTQKIENSYKKAYLSSLLLHIYAQLFEEGHQPVTLKWSYPSAMSNNLVGQYIQIWATLSEVNPIVGGEKLRIFNPNTSVEYNTAGASVFGNGETKGWGNTETPTQSWGTGGSSPWGNAPEGQQSPPATGWGAPSAQPAQSLKEIKTETGPIKFDFKTLGNEESLTEACAVANYLANNPTFEKTMDYLTLCFDVGGSTTDITALCQMMGPNGPGLAMVKQNSIRFAAQRISFATKHSPNFRSVLMDMCERKKIAIQGLNKTPYKYTPETAPYYFEQLVDRLDEGDFKEFYELLRGKCPEIMSINIYVTGLIMYYAGQIAYKLRNEIVNSPDKHPAMGDWKPIINIAFAGKGARIFDWFKAINETAANKYYIDMFIQGFGGMEKAQKNLYPGGYNGGPPIRINPTNDGGTANIKYEVSKGLAFPTESLLVPKNNEAIEILGEEGFCVLNGSGQKINLTYESSITPEMMQHIGTHFISSPAPGQPPCPKFMDFAGIYFQVASGMFGLKMTPQDFMQGFQTMNINSYIKQLPEYRLASESFQKGENKRFDFVAPIIILQGMKFLESTLLKGLAK